MLDLSQVSSGFTTGLKRFILWDYPRGSRQYDVMVVIILADSLWKWIGIWRGTTDHTLHESPYVASAITGD